MAGRIGPVSSGPDTQSVLDGHVAVSGRSVVEERAAALSNQSIKQLLAPDDIAALPVFLASDLNNAVGSPSAPNAHSPHNDALLQFLRPGQLCKYLVKCGEWHMSGFAGNLKHQAIRKAQSRFCSELG